MEAARAISRSVRLEDEIEMLVCNIELTTCSMNKLSGLSLDSIFLCVTLKIPLKIAEEFN